MSEPPVTVVDVVPTPTADQLEVTLSSTDAGVPRRRADTGAQRAGWVCAIGAAHKAGRTQLDLAAAETHLPPEALKVKLTRTTCPMDHVADGAGSPTLLGVVVEEADPDYPAVPRPDLARLDHLPDSIRTHIAAAG